MVGLLEQNTQELQSASPAESPRVDFTQVASIPEQTQKLLGIGNTLQTNFAIAVASDDIEAIRSARAALQQHEKDTAKLIVRANAAMLDHDLQDMRAMIGAITQDEIGRKFLEREAEGRCTIAIDRELLGKESTAPLATYQSYSYDKGLINEILINEYKLGNIYSLINGVEHEQFHRFQAMSAPALSFSPLNPDTQIIVHPEDWIHLENLAERDAYAKQAMMNFLLSKTHPEARSRSEYDVVSVPEFEEFMSIFPSLQNSVVHASLNALYKPTVENDFTRVFFHHYQEGALDRYIGAMGKRARNGETNHVFVRLEPADFWAVGAYDVGPNSLGEHHIDPGFLKRMPMSEDEQRRLGELCRKFNIPALESCPPLSKFTNAETKPEDSLQPVQRYGGHMSSTAVHAPVFQ